MSVILPFDETTIEKKEKLLKEYILPKNTSIYNPEKEFYKFYKIDRENRQFYIPIGNWKFFLKELNFNFPKQNFTVNFDLLKAEEDERKRDQDIVAKEALLQLKYYNSVFLALHTGFGKCLAKGTNVIMNNGELKKVELLRTGDALMGFDNKPTKITGICRGIDRMFQIEIKHPNYGNYLDKYTVNSAHLITVKKEGNILDIPAKELYKMQKNGRRFQPVYKGIQFEEKKNLLDPGFLGKTLRGMVEKNSNIPLIPSYIYANNDFTMKSFLNEFLISKELIYIFNKKFEKNIKIIERMIRCLGNICYTKTTEYSIYLFCPEGFDRKKNDENILFEMKITKLGVDLYYGFELDQDPRFFLESTLVTHNTKLAVYLGSKINEKIAVLAHSDIVKKQWVEEFEKSTNAKVQVVKGNKEIDPECNVYVIGIKKSSKMKRSDFKEISILIIDEAHIASITAFTESVFLFSPKYLIGLSATPDRNDGMDKLFPLFFGDRFITRKERKNFTVIKRKTKFRPKLEYHKVNGKMILNWSLVTNSIETNEERWKMIVDDATNFLKDKIVLILSYLKVQSQGIYELLVNEKENVDYLFGTEKKTYNPDCRVLVAGLKKAGAGFNDPRLTALIMASDCTDIRQYEGRIRTVNNIIIDYVDSNSALEKHWNLRKEWYEEKGATIIDYDEK